MEKYHKYIKINKRTRGSQRKQDEETYKPTIEQRGPSLCWRLGKTMKRTE